VRRPAQVVAASGTSGEYASLTAGALGREIDSDGATYSITAVGTDCETYVPRVVNSCGVWVGAGAVRAAAIQSSSSWNHGRGNTHDADDAALGARSEKPALTYWLNMRIDGER
jgi:hypothetical protein